MATASAAPSDALLLLEGKEAKLVQRLLVDTFRYRVDGMSEKKLAAWAGQLEVQGDRMQEVVSDLLRVIQGTLYSSLDRNGTVKLLPRGASKDLKILLANAIAERVDAWRENCVNSQVSPPKLVDFDWRVDVASSSNVLSHMMVPAVLVELTIQEQATQSRQMASTKNVQFELSKEALGTLVKSLGKIRDQLSNIK